MLQKLLIRSIALLDEIEITFGEGLHVLTGETGAGKSIVVDAVNLLLGGRADRELIRTGCDKAYVEGVFDVSANADAQAWLRAQEMEDEAGSVTLSREITQSGRSVSRVQGVAMPLAAVKALSALLMDIHGQHEHQSLLDERFHLGCLDAMGDGAHQALRARTAEAYEAYHAAATACDQLLRDSRAREERLELLRAQAEELEKAALVPGEEDALRQERDRYRGSEKITFALHAAYEALYEGKQGTATGLARDAMRALDGVARLGEDLAQLSGRAEALYYEAEDLALTVRAKLDEADFDPERAAFVDERLDLLRRLSRKYGATAEDMLTAYEGIKDELRRFEHMDDTLATFKERKEKALAVYRTAAAQLSTSRHALASAFQARMEKQLNDLNMRGTRFFVDFGKPADKPVSGGGDDVCFLIAPNAGEEKKPLAKIASGGELSRVMLALKAISAERAEIPSMVFDEIDTGISGRTAQVVAEKMWDIARFRQVICVTHLQQIAAMATRHYLIEKSERNGRTVTEICELSGEKRTAEIARMLSGVSAQSESALTHAREMLREAGEYRASAI